MKYIKSKPHYKFVCDWPECGEEFTVPVSSACAGHKCVSTQVQCKKCLNFLPNESGK